MAPGHRVRVLLEWYVPDWDRQAAERWLSDVELRVDDMFPDAIVASYVESNPPSDELL